jgi:DNA gyrase subunit A
MSEEIEKPKFPTINIEEEMQGAYLEYSMSVIAGRALPDIRDGLKPVHRRILYAMHNLGNTFEKKHLKSARIVGDVIGKYHPHGDSAVYHAMVRMAQDFSMRYTIVDGQGNFGSVDGDNPAAMRYTESRMSKLGGQMLADIEKETVEFGPNYDGSMTEPKVLPTQFPNLIVNGSGGIAVGMSTNIPPHNLTEVLKGTMAYIDNPAITVDQLMEFIPGPDLPTRGIITNLAGIRRAYHSGRGSFSIKGRAEIETFGKDRECIVVTELPFQVNKADWIQNIARLARDKEIEGISDIRDESDRTGIRVVIDIRKGEQANVILNTLYAKTQLQTSFGIITLAIDNGRPRLFSLKDMIVSFIDHRRDVVTRRCVFELAKAEAKEHILEGLKIALENIDAVVEVIKKAPSANEAKLGLIESFGLSEKQSAAILEMRLSRLTALETQKLLDELAELKVEIAGLKLILSTDVELFKVIKAELALILEKFGDERRSEISREDDKDFAVEDFIQPDDVVLTISQQGYAKRTSAAEYRAQGRGGKGIRGAGMSSEEDFISQVFVANTHWHLLCFTNLGKLHWLKVYQIPEMARTARGRPLQQMIQLEQGEKVLSILPVKEFSEDQFVVMGTKAGVIKKTSLMNFSNIRSNGIIAMTFDEGDELIKVALSSGKDHIFMATKQGQSIRFPEDDVRPMGRTARGVRGINVDANDAVVGMDVLPASDEETKGITILSVSTKGYGKRTPVDEYRAQGRGGSGIINLKTTDKIGELVGVKVVRDNDDVIVVTNGGQLIRTRSADISVMGRNTQGVRVIRLDDNELVQGIATVNEAEMTGGEPETVH